MSTIAQHSAAARGIQHPGMLAELRLIEAALTKAGHEILAAAEASGDNPTISRARDAARSITGPFPNLPLSIARAKALGLTGVEVFLSQMLDLGYMRVITRLQDGYDFPSEKSQAQRAAVVAACKSRLGA